MKEKKREGGHDKGSYFVDSRFLALVFGILSALNTIEDAIVWVKTEIGKLRLQLPIDTFVKDTEGIFKGLLFAKFSSLEARDSVVEGFKNISMSKEHTQWVKPDLPAVVRAPQIFLFGFKKMLIDWNFNKGVVKVDTDMNTLVVDGKRVVQVSVHENTMHYVWAEEWQNWPEFQED